MLDIYWVVAKDPDLLDQRPTALECHATTNIVNQAEYLECDNLGSCRNWVKRFDKLSRYTQEMTD